MNSIIKNYYPLFELYQSLRKQIMDALSDEDLAFTPGGDNPTLGALCREIGEIEYAYIQSFKTFTINFSYQNEEPGLENSVDKLNAWYAKLDAELRSVIEGLSEDDIQNRKVDRGHNFQISAQHQLDIYKEALLIFYGKVTVYFKVQGRTVSEHWADWIG